MLQHFTSVTTYPEKFCPSFSFYVHAFRYHGEKYERKTNRGNNKENLEKAADAVKNLGKSIRSAAKDYSVCHV